MRWMSLPGGMTSPPAKRANAGVGGVARRGAARRGAERSGAEGTEVECSAIPKERTDTAHVIAERTTRFIQPALPPSRLPADMNAHANHKEPMHCIAIAHVTACTQVEGEYRSCRCRSRPNMSCTAAARVRSASAHAHLAVRRDVTARMLECACGCHGGLGTVQCGGTREGTLRTDLQAAEALLVLKWDRQPVQVPTLEALRGIDPSGIGQAGSAKRDRPSGIGQVGSAKRDRPSGIGQAGSTQVGSAIISGICCKWDRPSGIGQVGSAKWDRPSKIGQAGSAKWDRPSGIGQVGSAKWDRPSGIGRRCRYSHAGPKPQQGDSLDGG